LVLSSEEKLINGLKMVIEGFAEMIAEKTAEKYSQNVEPSNLYRSNSRRAMTMAEAAAYSGLTKNAIYWLARASKIKHVRIGSKYIFYQDGLDEFIKQSQNNSIKKEEEPKSGAIRKVKT
jgi:excisionase family DNA binding protein